MAKKDDDEIVGEIRRRRKAYAKAHGYDLKRIGKDVQRKERESGVPLVQRAPRKPATRRKRNSA